MHLGKYPHLPHPPHFHSLDSLGQYNHTLIKMLHENLGDILFKLRELEENPLENTSEVSPPQITANQTDYNPAGLPTTASLRLDLDAARTINSLAGGSLGRVLMIQNISGFALTLLHDDGATGTAAMRFLLPGAVNLSIPAGAGVILRYDNTSLRWRVVAKS